MKSHARVVVVGGGCAGASVLYHLALAGWSDVVLCEREALAAGATARGAGVLAPFSAEPTLREIHCTTARLADAFAEDPATAFECTACGDLRLARTQDRMDELRRYASWARAVGVSCELLTPADARGSWPLAADCELVGGLYQPQGRRMDPVALTRGLAVGARDHGAEVYEGTAVAAVQRNRRSGEWVVSTNRGDIVCEHVVTALGSDAGAAIAKWFGESIPVVSLRHRYWRSDGSVEWPSSRLPGYEGPLPTLHVPDDGFSFYPIAEALGFEVFPADVAAAPEEAGTGQRDKATPAHSDGDAIAWGAAASAWVPAVAGADAGHWVDGRVAYSPDGRPLVGPLFGLPNVWLAEALSRGTASAGGVGRHLAAMIAEGEPGIDMAPLHPQRFGSHVRDDYAVAAARVAYTHSLARTQEPTGGAQAEFALKQAPVSDRLQARGARFGERNGWAEVVDFNTTHTATEAGGVAGEQGPDHRPSVAAQCRAVRERVGLIEASALAKYELSGSGAFALLRSFCASPLPDPGEIGPGYALRPAGRVDGVFTIARLAENRFYLVAEAVAERHLEDRLVRGLPGDGSVRLDNVSDDWGVLVVAGPHADRLLHRICRDDLGDAAFPRMSWRDLPIGRARARVLRIDPVGERGWALHHKLPLQGYLYDLLVAAGTDLGLEPIGRRAWESLRLETSCRQWGEDIGPYRSAVTAGLVDCLDWSVDFVGRAAVEQEIATRPPERWVTLGVETAAVEPQGGEPLWHGDRVVGWSTSAGYGHTVEQVIALGYVESALAEAGARLQIEVLGERLAAEVLHSAPSDSRGERSGS